MGGKAVPKKSRPKNLNNESMETKLDNILKRTRVAPGQPYNFQSIEPAAKYYIGDELEDFFDAYSHCVRMGLSKTLQERPELYGPLRVDIDIKCDLECGTKRQFDDEFIKKFVKFYQEAIYSVVHEDTYKPLIATCIVLIKNKPRKEADCVKDGFHLHFPHFICEPWMQDKHLRSIVMKRIIDEKLTKNLNIKESVEKIIDTDIAKKAWILYGSAKALGAEPYRVHEIYNVNLKPISIKKAFPDDVMKKKNQDLYLPRLLSIRGHKETTDLKYDIEKKKCNYEIKRKKANVHRTRTDDQIMEDLKKIQDSELMEMLSNERADDYAKWMEVGWTLFNIGQGCDEALDMWIEFSQRSEKFQEGVCEKEWSTMKLSSKGMGSLYFMAKEDSPDQFKALKDSDINNLVRSSLDTRKPNELKVARVFHKRYENRFICSGFKKEAWYEYVGHVWNEIDGGQSLYMLFSTDLVQLYSSFQKKLTEQGENLEGDEKTRNNEKQKKCFDIIEALMTCNFQRNVFRMCCTLFYDGSFLGKRDQNRKLFACENGILDLEMQVFRPGRPDDFITLTNARYYRDFDPNDPLVKEFKLFIRKIFPNKNIREYFLDVCCATLEGGNVNKIIIFLTGYMGDNGKSVIMNWLQTLFNDAPNGLCITFQRETFMMNSNSSAGQARPDLVQIRGKRLGLLNEVTNKESINTGKLKELSGGGVDKVYARGLWESGGPIRVELTTFVACNTNPRVEDDQATWNRIRQIDCQSKFVLPKHLKDYPVPETLKEQFKMKRFLADTNLDSRMSDYADVGLWFLFKRFPEYKKRGLKEPPEVLASTEKYRAANDVILNYIKEMIVETDEDKEITDRAFVSFNELANDFYIWFKQRKAEYAMGVNPPKQTLKEEFCKRLKRFGKKGKLEGWYGYILDKGDEQLETAQLVIQEKTESKEVPKKKVSKETEAPKKKKISKEGKEGKKKKKSDTDIIVTKKNLRVTKKGTVEIILD